MTQRQRPPYDLTVFVCAKERDDGEPACGNRGSDELAGILRKYVKTHGLKPWIRVSKSQCFDLCEEGPNIAVFPQDHWFSACGKTEVEEILATYIRPIEERLRAAGKLPARE